MKFFFITMLALLAVACASPQRSPSHSSSEHARADFSPRDMDVYQAYGSQR